MLATGHSCRSQVERALGFTPKHPAEALLAVLEKREAAGDVAERSRRESVEDVRVVAVP